MNDPEAGRQLPRLTGSMPAPLGPAMRVGRKGTCRPPRAGG